MALTARQVEIIRSTAPILKQQGNAVATSFYADIFDKAPVMNNVFNRAAQDNGHQAQAVAAALHAYAAHIDDLGTLDPSFEKICSIHASMYVQPEQYVIVGNFLLQAMARVLGSASTQEMLDAWTIAYRQLADIFIANETRFYQKTSANDWKSWRDMVIVRKDVESDVITSFYLRPVDGRALPSFHSGQFVSVQMKVEELGYLQSRQYSLSDAPGKDYYRISVKKEEGVSPGHPGYVSNLLHDSRDVGMTLQVSHPQGDFFPDVQACSASPIVLISAGVGITPTMSMLNHLLQIGASQPVVFLHGARSSGSRAFHEYLTDISSTHANIRYSSFVEQRDDSDDAQTPAQRSRSGRLDLNKVDFDTDLHLSDATTQYYVCGPEKFMVDVQEFLSKQGADQGRIHKETFGPGEWPQKADAV